MNSKTILVVDDSPTDLLNLKGIVEDAKFNVVTATSGAQALTVARQLKPSLIFMDIVMDEVDGYKACRAIGADPETKDIPVVFVSSKNQRADQIWAEKQGGKALVSKPYTAEQIHENISRFA